MRFSKYHALGNDYLVFDPAEVGHELTAAQLRRICDRHFGIGSDGVLWGPMGSREADFELRIFNPDGSEAEKSGNGLRIFARYLWDRRRVRFEPFTVLTKGGKVRARVHPGGGSVTVEMGRVSFDSARIPVLGPQREVINETLTVAGRELTYCAATVGNPHCVVLADELSAAEACRLGPLIENDPRFPNRTNVQFMCVLDRARIRIETWERGAGYTLASGSSSCAAAAVARRLGLCDRRIAVHMPGGVIEVEVGVDFSVSMTGPVAPIYDGTLEEETLDACPETEKNNGN